MPSFSVIDPHCLFSTPWPLRPFDCAIESSRYPNESFRIRVRRREHIPGYSPVHTTLSMVRSRQRLWSGYARVSACIYVHARRTRVDVEAPAYNSVLPWNDSFICVRLIESLPRGTSSLILFISLFLSFIRTLPAVRTPIVASFRYVRTASSLPSPSSTPTRLAVSISPRRTKLKGVPVVYSVRSWFFSFCSPFVSSFFKCVIARVFLSFRANAASSAYTWRAYYYYAPQHYCWP